MPRPRIACFHGGGSNSEIFSVQTAQLEGLLTPHFDLIYLDGPFTRSAGPGVLPAFADYGPFHSWFDTTPPGERKDGSGYDEAGTGGIARVWELLERQGEGGDWVGVMGFSQGSRVVGGMLLDVQRKRSRGESLGKGVDIRFGVLCMGSGAPMTSNDPTGTSLDIITIPTLHVHGLKDMFLPLGRHQYETFYGEESRRLYEVDYHHAMPWVKEEVRVFGEMIRALERDTRGN